MINSAKVTIWNREFNLDIIYQRYPGEEITASQESTANTITKINFNSSLNAVKDYILENNQDELGRDEVTNVFRYVMPNRIFITRSDRNLFAIACNYKFDLEHGLAVIFENGIFKEVGPLDLII